MEWGWDDLPDDDKQPGEGGRSSPKPHVDALWLRPLSNGATWTAGLTNKYFVYYFAIHHPDGPIWW